MYEECTTTYSSLSPKTLPRSTPFPYPHNVCALILLCFISLLSPICSAHIHNYMCGLPLGYSWFIRDTPLKKTDSHSLSYQLLPVALQQDFLFYWIYHKFYNSTYTLFIYPYVALCMECVYVICECSCLQRPEEGIRSPKSAQHTTRKLTWDLCKRSMYS